MTHLVRRLTGQALSPEGSDWQSPSEERSSEKTKAENPEKAQTFQHAGKEAVRTADQRRKSSMEKPDVEPVDRSDDCSPTMAY